MNRHPVDRLADIRASTKLLKEHGASLRAEVLDHTDDLVGDENEASSRRSTVENLDIAAIKSALGRSSCSHSHTYASRS
jgi:hypothetical protein